MGGRDVARSWSRKGRRHLHCTSTRLISIESQPKKIVVVVVVVIGGVVVAKLSLSPSKAGLS